MKSKSIKKSVVLATAEENRDEFSVPKKWRCGGRCGTLFTTIESFGEKVGDPHERAPKYRDYDGEGIDGAGKITALWRFITPRGQVEVSDYWWNPIDQLSVRALDVRALRWFRRWAKICGLQMTNGNGK